MTRFAFAASVGFGAAALALVPSSARSAMPPMQAVLVWKKKRRVICSTAAWRRVS